MAVDAGRRRFISALGRTALGLSPPAVSATIAALSSASAFSAATAAALRTVKFHDGTIVPALGQGSAYLGQGRHPQAVEEEALRTGVSLGMTLIDTSDDYGKWPLREIDRPSDCGPARPRIPRL